MRLSLPAYCFICKEYAGHVIEISDSGYYEFECINGHQSKFIVQEQLFELLFEIGISAIYDGYYREAISSFTSSLERFYEYYVKLMMYKNVVDEKEIEATWKKVSNQSERQLGAFIFLYLAETRTMPTLLSDSNVQFRNTIIHKGKIPTRNQSIEYGQAILDHINPILNDLKINYSEHVMESVFRHKKNIIASKGITNTQMAIPTILSLTQPPQNELSLREGLAKYDRKW